MLNLIGVLILAGTLVSMIFHLTFD